MSELVPLENLVDADALRAARGRPADLRAALPRGWVPADDGLHARRDRRLLFREGWVLIAGLVVFGAAGASFLWGAMPHGWSGVLRIGGLALAVALAGGIVAPIVTRALARR